MTSKPNRKSPEWREFEKLVARIEGALLKHGAVIQSPDRIRSLLTNRLREVDASIRAQVGSAEILITLECRKRSAKQDATWLEQLGNKKVAIGAARTIAVSTSEFSSDAMKLAAHYGIDLRIVKNITESDIEKWLFIQSVIHVYKSNELLGPPEISFEMQKGETADNFNNPESTDLNAKVFINSNDEKLSFNDLWLIAEQQPGLWDKVPRDGSVLKVNITLDVADELKVNTSAGPRQVKQIIFPMALSWQKEVIPLSESKAYVYESPISNICPTIHRVEFKTKKATKNLRLGFQTNDSSENCTITAEFLENETQKS